MADQDELVQMGSETMLEDSMAQDDSFEGDHSLQPCPEVTLGATATATMLGHPLHQISPTEDRAIPMGSIPNHSRSASPEPWDTNQMVEMIKQMMELGRNQQGMMKQMMERMELAGNQQK